MSITVQETLTENAPILLDSTCSEAKMWPRFATLRMDIRREAAPDIIASAAALPFRDGIFSIIYCDPPFTIRERRRNLGHSDHGFILRMERFGLWKTRSNWENFLAAINQEFKRALAPRGHVEFKISDLKEDVHSKDLAIMSNFDRSIKKAWRSKAGCWRKSAAPTYIFEMTPKEL